MTFHRVLPLAAWMRAITEATLDQSVTRIAALQGELRTLHLRTHLTMRALLTEDQTDRYDQLCGYCGNDGHQHNEY